MKDNIHIAAMKRGAPYVMGFFVFIALFIKFPQIMTLLLIIAMMVCCCYCIGRAVMATTGEDRKYEE